MSFYGLDKQGRYAGVGFYPGVGSYAICDENGAKTLQMEPVFEGKSEE